jgi:hypothetical protein
MTLSTVGRTPSTLPPWDSGPKQSVTRTLTAVLGTCDRDKSPHGLNELFEGAL